MQQARLMLGHYVEKAVRNQIMNMKLLEFVGQGVLLIKLMSGHCVEINVLQINLMKKQEYVGVHVQVINKIWGHCAVIHVMLILTI